MNDDSTQNIIHIICSESNVFNLVVSPTCEGGQIHLDLAAIRVTLTTTWIGKG